MAIFRHFGNFNHLERFLSGASKLDPKTLLDRYGQEGVRALMEATPKDTGMTAESWGYKITKNKTGYKLSWTNSNTSEGIPIVILIQYGHGTGTGAYVHGRDFINPAIRPILDKLAKDLVKEVSEL
jgi:hypothetical protein